MAGSGGREQGVGGLCKGIFVSNPTAVEVTLGFVDVSVWDVTINENILCWSIRQQRSLRLEPHFFALRSSRGFNGPFKGSVAHNDPHTCTFQPNLLISKVTNFN